MFIKRMLRQFNMLGTERLATMQIRKGDRYHEMEEDDKRNGYSSFRQQDFVRVYNALANMSFDAVFLATDSAETLKYIRKRLSKVSVFAQEEATRVYFAQAHHQATTNLTVPSLGLEVIADIQMLASSSSRVLIGNCFSGMSTVPAAMIVGDNMAYRRLPRDWMRPIAVDGGCIRYSFWCAAEYSSK